MTTPVKFDWGSVSTRMTLYPLEASIHPKLNVVVVLLTPPLWLNSAILLTISLPSANEVEHELPTIVGTIYSARKLRAGVDVDAEEAMEALHPGRRCQRRSGTGSSREMARVVTRAR